MPRHAPRSLARLVAVAAALLVAISAAVAWWYAAPGGPSGPSGAGSASAQEVVACSASEQLTYHVHAHLAIFIAGQPVPVPAGIGILRTCISWLHTHDADGVIHVEAPAPHTYALGSFFRLWGQPLDAQHLLDRTVDGEHSLRAYVGGKEFTGSPETIPLTPHAVIVLEYGPPFAPPPPYSFPPGA